MYYFSEPCLEKKSCFYHMSRAIRKPAFADAKTKMQIRCAVTTQLISIFVLATWIVQSHYYLNRKFQASSQLLWLYSPVCVDLVGNSKDRFSHNEAKARGACQPVLAWACYSLISIFVVYHVSRHVEQYFQVLYEPRCEKTGLWGF